MPIGTGTGVELNFVRILWLIVDDNKRQGLGASNLTGIESGNPRDPTVQQGTVPCGPAVLYLSAWLIGRKIVG